MCSCDLNNADMLFDHIYDHTTKIEYDESWGNFISKYDNKSLKILPFNGKSSIGFLNNNNKRHIGFKTKHGVFLLFENNEGAYNIICEDSFIIKYVDKNYNWIFYGDLSKLDIVSKKTKLSKLMCYISKEA